MDNKLIGHSTYRTFAIFLEKRSIEPLHIIFIFFTIGNHYEFGCSLIFKIVQYIFVSGSMVGCSEIDNPIF
jgi:hypothetical protein